MSEAPPKLCYRCNATAKCDYMGLHYCIICVSVVSQLSHLIQHGAPIGFPTAPPGDPDYFLKQGGEAK